MREPGGTVEPEASTRSEPVETPDTRADTVAFGVRVTPTTAVIELDGRPLPSNPYSARLPADDNVHWIVAKAAGYEENAKAVRFNDDVVVELALEPLEDEGKAKVRRKPRHLPPRGLGAAGPARTYTTATPKNPSAAPGTPSPDFPELEADPWTSEKKRKKGRLEVDPWE